MQTRTGIDLSRATIDEPITMIPAGVKGSNRIANMTDDSSMQEDKALVAGFLRQCNAYAEEKLRQYRAEAATTGDGERAAELAAKIHDWSVYRQFNDYTIEELATERLDAWFAPPGDAPG